MLPPTNARSGLVLAHHRTLVTTAFKASTSSMLRTGISQPRRSLWGWRRPKDWTSHLDPLYQRYHSHRTLKTRAKLLDKLRRRGKFDWGLNNADFFSPKHVRWASRWDDNGWKRKHPWYANDDAEDNKKKSGRDAAEEGEVGGYELSPREKLWQKQMEAMRKRVGSDPYEALFGKRFEPFWSPLVPSWMREEMGLPAWKKEGETVKKPEADKKEEPTKKAETTKTSHDQTADLLNMEKKLADMLTTVNAVANGKTISGVQPAQAKPLKSSSYAYASSTSWDSSSNRTKRVEWDSASGKTKKYEYDPISNRMVEVQVSKPVPPKAIEQPEKSAKMAVSTAATRKAEETTVVHNSTGILSKLQPASQPSSRGVDIPVKQPKDVRKSIPIPPPLSQPSYSVPIGFSPKPTSLGPWKSTAVAAEVLKPSALATVPVQGSAKPAEKTGEPDLNDITAESIRARISKLKPTKQTVSLPPPPATNPQQQGEQEASFNSLDAQPQIEVPWERCMVRHASPRPSLWDQAEKEVMLQSELDSLNGKKAKLLKDEQGLFHIERQKRELSKLDQRIRMLGDRIGNVNTTLASSDPSARAKSQSTPENKSSVLQPSIDRMQSKQEVTSKTTNEDVDADDAAAHESTEPLDLPVKATVPEGWERQADLLQADRVKRTAAKVPYPDMQSLITSRQSTPRKTREKAALGLDNLRAELDEHVPTQEVHKPEQGWTGSGVRALDSRHEVAKPPEPLDTFQAFVDYAKMAKLSVLRLEGTAKGAPWEHAPIRLPPPQRIEGRKQANADAERAAKLEKANKLLEEEVREQKSRMQAHEGRYADKIRSLRIELEVAYKQSAVHGEKHVEHIRTLEKDLADARKSSAQVVPSESKYADKIRSLRAELDVAYKQSALHGEKHVERIRALEKELAQSKKSGAASAPSQAAPLPQAEGDLCPTAPTFAGSEKWYKQATVTPASIRREKEKAEQKKRDQKLVREVQGIYEKAYGVIDAEHKQPLAMKSETKKAKNVVEVESDVDLGEALAKYETDQKQTYTFKKDKLENEVVAREREAHEGIKLVDDTRTPLKRVNDIFATNSADATAEPTPPEAQAVQSDFAWAEPPSYRIFADYGTSEVSTTTTDSGSTSTEAPITIASALSQLESPSAFLSHLEAAQRDGFQVMHAAKDLLVFRKVADVEEQDVENRHALPMYKILANGGWGVGINSVTTMSHVPSSETPISIAGALCQLEKPGPFLPHIETAHKEGFEVIHANKNLLVFQKVPEVKEREVKAGLEDHGVLSPPTSKPSSPDEAGEGARSSGSGVNPIDGTTALATEPHYVSGGASENALFVEPREQTEEHDYDIRHYPRVKREEYPVFTGTKRKWNSNHRRHSQRVERERERESKDRKKSRWRWVLGTGLGAATVAYAVGAAAERGRATETAAARNAAMKEAEKQQVEKYDISDGLILGTFVLLSIVLLL